MKVRSRPVIVMLAGCCAVLCTLHAQANEYDALGRLKLCSVKDDLWSVFLITGLDRVFRFAPDLMTALAGIQIEAEG